MLPAPCLWLTVDATRVSVSAGRECRVTTAVTMLAQYLFRYQVSSYSFFFLLFFWYAFAVPIPLSEKGAAPEMSRTQREKR